MSKLPFKSNPEPTLGIELEVALVDAETMALSSSIQEVLDRIPEPFAESVKPELMQCYLEINTGVCRTVADAEADLTEKVLAVQDATDQLGLRLLWTATHPFSLWRDQKVTPTERYKLLLSLLQDMARQLITFGLHVHVGVESGDKAIGVIDRLHQRLPLLLALTCNSPFWDNRVTGLQSSRSKVMEGLPTAGLPFPMRTWSEYTWLINHLMETGFINTIREIWWDVRPHHNFGTVEVRVCDMPGRLEDVLAIAALVQCLVKYEADSIDEGAWRSDYHPMIVRQNKWRASRFGLQARLVDGLTYQCIPVPEMATDLVRQLWPVAEELDCQQYLQRILAMASGQSWADRQLRILQETGDPAEVVRQMTEISRLQRVEPPSAVAAA
jgi:glutamate---cysteine ligase / carboxylate-amine ligase